METQTQVTLQPMHNLQ